MIDDVDTAMRVVHTGLATLTCPDELQGTGLVTSWHEHQRYLALARAEQLYVDRPRRNTLLACRSWSSRLRSA
jgi:hypothetical protein